MEKNKEKKKVFFTWLSLCFSTTKKGRNFQELSHEKAKKVTHRPCLLCCLWSIYFQYVRVANSRKWSCKKCGSLSDTRNLLRAMYELWKASENLFLFSTLLLSPAQFHGDEVSFFLSEEYWQTIFPRLLCFFCCFPHFSFLPVCCSKHTNLRISSFLLMKCCFVEMWNFNEERKDCLLVFIPRNFLEVHGIWKVCVFFLQQLRTFVSSTLHFNGKTSIIFRGSC